MATSLLLQKSNAYQVYRKDSTLVKKKTFVQQSLLKVEP